ncbi:GNAT family N-acetyltransferase [Streptococcus dentapri]|uniref:GNAT family N-acetyltransferase n=1 Tax=Streptococcus dentapri TaxID=573564 RepID=A0ABV8CZ39_9STRE
MIRTFTKNDLSSVMEIWLEANIRAHNFIPEKYWQENYSKVEYMLPQAEIYVYQDANMHQILGFIGLMENYIAGIFVKESEQSKGIGCHLLNFVKGQKNNLSLSVYQKNVRAVSFYEREQFTVQSESIDKNTNEKEFVMTWIK